MSRDTDHAATEVEAAKQRNLIGLRERHNDYIARVKALGKAIVTFKAPCCGKDIETPAAPSAERWTTLATCQHCGALYMKVTEGSTVTAALPRE